MSRRSELEGRVETLEREVAELVGAVRAMQSGRSQVMDVRLTEAGGRVTVTYDPPAGEAVES